MPSTSRRGWYAAVAAAVLVVGLAGHAARADTASGRVVFTISSPLITESSSLVVSTVHPGLVYTANDSGDSATVYVLDASNGDLVGETSLSGVTAVDVEAMGAGSDGSLVVGDIGDNHDDRVSVAVYKIPQPDRGNQSVSPKAVTLTYRDGPRNAESLLYDARTGRIFIASKLFGGAKVYRSPPQVFTRTHAAMVPFMSAPAIATDATFVRNQRYAVIRTYFGAVAYTFPAWKHVAIFDLPRQPQGESVAAPPGGHDLWIGSEGVSSKVLQVRLPDLAPKPAVSPGAPTTTVTTHVETVVSRPHQRLRSIAWVVMGGAAAALVLVLGIGLVMHHRHRHV